MCDRLGAWSLVPGWRRRTVKCFTALLQEMAPLGQQHVLQTIIVETRTSVPRSLAALAPSSGDGRPESCIAWCAGWVGLDDPWANLGSTSRP